MINQHLHERQRIDVELLADRGALGGGGEVLVVDLCRGENRWGRLLRPWLLDYTSEVE